MSSFDDFDRAAAAVTKIIDAVGPGQLGLPTACAEWDVRAVVNHLVQGNLKTVAWVTGGPPPEERDRLGDDFRAVFAGTLRQARAALTEPGLLERTVQTPLGPAPGALLVRMRINEYLAHGWDIADATGQSTDFEPELAEQALAAWRSRFADTPRGPGGPFGPERAVRADASAADRLAAFLGREPVGNR